MGELWSPIEVVFPLDLNFLQGQRGQAEVMMQKCTGKPKVKSTLGHRRERVEVGC